MSDYYVYRVDNGLYINVTNRCSCNCVFCVRKSSDGINQGESLWLQKEPSLEEITQDIVTADPTGYYEVVFCGYGEPTECLETVLDVAKFIKKNYCIPIRLNTNGLSDLIYGCSTAKEMEGLIDTISISLNAPTKEEYLSISNPRFGLGSFDAMLQFAQDCKKYIPNVLFTVVDVIDSEKIETCKKLAAQMNIECRIRTKI
ncbi:MAG: TIGR04100 family radical SAM protein [Christensenellaceae bacterium]|nr:TIGR04100 family radical SAM protein [Christensenellaceae bacterium]